MPVILFVCFLPYVQKMSTLFLFVCFFLYVHEMFFIIKILLPWQMANTKSCIFTEKYVNKYIG